METGAITDYIDVAQLVLYIFWGFFFGLIIYLRREDRREGYPLEDERGVRENSGYIWIPEPKKFISIHDGSATSVPNFIRETREIKGQPTAPWPGAPMEPIGDPMLAEIGPGSYADRPDVPDLTLEGDPKIVPLRAAPGFGVASQDPDPRDMSVYGFDGELGGVVKDVWVDRSDILFRYLEVETRTSDGPVNVLVPLNFAEIDGSRGRIRVHAIGGAHFANAPKLKNPEQVTLLEEERTVAYFGAGMLYAHPSRQEPLI